ncbi:2-oxoglutarate ferredoxin oxidoreductase subunit gamma [Symbiobacterium terraclitae]|uniref:2-oxoglutarate ferredoxin oxidoreductase subunit gamma n=1 Tax=Symbiobacterium terraclitae TaxID=557451 RepID=A0ABS4JVL3_9FIRM|nr:2-oxoglutarate ferredoxin oxidoreductase subunit gamma [Symbiobacterium terraclitae]
MKQIMLTGSGGQGMILAGIILAKAGIRDGYEVTQTQSYGPEARGGASRAEVILDVEPIDFPKVTQADVVLAMTQEAAEKFHTKLRPGGTLIADPLYVHTVPAVDGQVHRVEITRLAREATGRPITANIVALGALNRICRLVSDEALVDAVLESVPRGTEEVNRKALEAGMRA